MSIAPHHPACCVHVPTYLPASLRRYDQSGCLDAGCIRHPAPRAAGMGWDLTPDACMPVLLYACTPVRLNCRLCSISSLVLSPLCPAAQETASQPATPPPPEPCSVDLHGYTHTVHGPMGIIRTILHTSPVTTPLYLYPFPTTSTSTSTSTTTLPQQPPHSSTYHTRTTTASSPSLALRSSSVHPPVCQLTSFILGTFLGQSASFPSLPPLPPLSYQHMASSTSNHPLAPNAAQGEGDVTPTASFEPVFEMVVLGSGGGPLETDCSG